jgi:hypothetical protein
VAFEQVNLTGKAQGMENAITESMGQVPEKSCVESCTGEGEERKHKDLAEHENKSKDIAEGGATGLNFECSSNVASSGRGSVSHVIESVLPSSTGFVEETGVSVSERSEKLDPEELIPGSCSGCSSCTGVLEESSDAHSARKTMNFRRYGPWRVLRDIRFSTLKRFSRLKRKITSCGTRGKRCDKPCGHWRELCDKRFIKGSKCALGEFDSRVRCARKLEKGRYQLRNGRLSNRKENKSTGTTPRGERTHHGQNVRKTMHRGESGLIGRDSGQGCETSEEGSENGQGSEARKDRFQGVREASLEPSLC